MPALTLSAVSASSSAPETAAADAITLANYRTMVAAEMGLDNTGSNPGSLTADQTLMHMWANRGYKVALSKTKVYVLTGTLTLSANNADFTIPNDILAITELFAPSSSGSNMWNRMQRLSSAEILELRYTQAGGVPPVNRYAVGGTNLLQVYPTPTESTILPVQFVPRPAVLSSDSDFAHYLPSEWHEVIELYMLWKAGRYTNNAPSQNGATFKTAFEAMLVDMESTARNYGGRALNPTPLGRRRRPVFQQGQDDGR